ncbi:PIN domain-containing protein [Mycobacteroides abscessus]|uniref:PIN domain-containing protein n=1 Tax=Mycobacteroides abscessus TaxID=36809 RepID=UPI0013000FD0|nr:PIN domain-containing protein [Mycobacteroides abscessus]
MIVLGSTYDELDPEVSIVFVIDTNVLFAEAAYRRGIESKVHRLAQFKRVLVVVPEIVVRETARHRAVDFTKSRATGAKLWGEALNALKAAKIELPDSLPTPKDLRKQVLPSPNDLADGLRADLVSKSVEIHPIPTSISHETLVEWSLTAHPPFDGTDKGYRDALIWASVREVACAAPDGCAVVFVTNDNDFCSKDEPGALHPSLGEDLDASTRRFIYFAIAKGIDEAIVMAMERSQPNRGSASARDELLASRIAYACEAMLHERLPEVLTERPHVGSTLEWLYIDAIVTELSPDLESLAVDSAEVLEGGTEIGSATVTADIGIEVVLPTTDYGELRDWRWYLIDGDYNEYSVLVGADFTCALSFSYTADRGIVRTLELTSMRIAAS